MSKPWKPDIKPGVKLDAINRKRLYDYARAHDMIELLQRVLIMGQSDQLPREVAEIVYPSCDAASDAIAALLKSYPIESVPAEIGDEVKLAWANDYHYGMTPWDFASVNFDSQGEGRKWECYAEHLKVV